MKTERIGFSRWTEADIALAERLWGDPAVTRYICASGAFTKDEIAKRLETELRSDKGAGVQYWPVFTPDTNELIGCCGLRPRREKEYELGFHLRPKFWGQGYATEAATAVIRYAFTVLRAEKLFAGHNPKNIASQKVLAKLGFAYVGDEHYAPTGLYHPSYELNKGDLNMRFAFLIMGTYHSDTDRAVIGNGSAQIVGVADIGEACAAAKRLQEEGVDCIELCGAFGESGAKKIIEATGNTMPVGYITHLPEQDAVYKAAFRG